MELLKQIAARIRDEFNKIYNGTKPAYFSTRLGEDKVNSKSLTQIESERDIKLNALDARKADLIDNKVPVGQIPVTEIIEQTPLADYEPKVNFTGKNQYLGTNALSVKGIYDLPTVKVQSVAGREGDVTLGVSDVNGLGGVQEYAEEMTETAYPPLPAGSTVLKTAAAITRRRYGTPKDFKDELDASGTTPPAVQNESRLATYIGYYVRTLLATKQDKLTAIPFITFGNQRGDTGASFTSVGTSWSKPPSTTGIYTRPLSDFGFVATNNEITNGVLFVQSTESRQSGSAQRLVCNVSVADNEHIRLEIMTTGGLLSNYKDSNFYWLAVKI